MKNFISKHRDGIKLSVFCASALVWYTVMLTDLVDKMLINFEKK